jgi:hypothetical protein
MAISPAVLTPTASTRRFAGASLCAGALAAIALPGNRLGLGMVLVAWLAIAAVAMSGALPRSRYVALALLLAAALAAVAGLRDASWLLWVDLIAAAIVVVTAAVDARTWPALVRSLFTGTRKLLPAPLAVAWFSGIRPAPGTRRRAIPVLRGLVLGWVLVLVFGTLFASADEAFAQLTDGVLTPDVDLGLLPARVGAGIAVVGICGAVVLAALAPVGANPAAKSEGHWSPEWLIALGLLNALFATFLAVQVQVLFGGNDHVLDTVGLTYAQYARAGFYQLLVVAFLVLAVVAVAGRRRGERTGRRPTPVEYLLGLLCLLTLVVLVSALRRLGLLEDTYGFTLTRLFGHTGTLWVGAVLALVMAAGAARRTELLPRAIVATTAAGLLAFSLANPEGLVASKNVDRFERTGKIDTGYLRTLGADATPALRRLPREQRAQASPVRSRAEGFFAYNLARARAR